MPCKFHANITLEEFISCPGNLAHNRQTRLLANLSILNCTEKKPTLTMKENMLSSAKTNLARLPMFGLTEYLFATQFIFEWTFNLDFIKNITSSITKSNIPQKKIKLVQNTNKYDMDLYKFASKLFFKRLEYIVSKQKKQNRLIPIEISNAMKSNLEH